MNNLKICLLFTLSINILSYSQVISEDEITNYAINNIEEFVEFLSYPNDANNKEDIEKLIDWTSNRFNKLGFDTKRLQTESVPLLLAELVYKKSYNTILIYLKSRDFWVSGFDSRAKKDFTKHDWNGRNVLLFGAEGFGLKYQTKKNSDFLHQINMSKNVESLNISNSASIVFHYLYQIKNIR